MSAMRKRAVLVAAALAALGCEPPQATPQTPVNDIATPAGTAPAAPDALGAKPALTEARAFTPPAPQVFQVRGITVWLLERRTLPLVAVTVVVPVGSADDPRGGAGLANITADMLDEGAGKRNAVDLSSAVSDLGATLTTGVRPDGSFASLSVLKKNFAPAFAILADVVARPRFDAREWKRVSTLWQNDLKKRGDDAGQVSRVVSSAVLYGPDTPYGHPSDGRVEDAKKVGLGDVKAFYKSAWRGDRSVIVIAGDITKDEVAQAVERELGAWGAPQKAEPAKPAPAATGWKPPRLVLVDRPGAPQSVIAVVRDGVSASDPRAPLLELINTALGGSFTSRLNQNLREDHGWSYGARSAFTEARGQGAFLARAAVVTEATGPALKEMLSELSKMAGAGLTQDELAKVQAQDRADLVESYETVRRASQRMATLASLGLAPTFDADASKARQAATFARLAELSSAVDPKQATVVVVGPRAEVLPQLQSLGLGEPVMWDVEGRPSP